VSHLGSRVLHARQELVRHQIPGVINNCAAEAELASVRDFWMRKAESESSACFCPASAWSPFSPQLRPESGLALPEVREGGISPRKENGNGRHWDGLNRFGQLPIALIRLREDADAGSQWPL